MGAVDVLPFEPVRPVHAFLRNDRPPTHHFWIRFLVVPPRFGGRLLRGADRRRRCYGDRRRRTPPNLLRQRRTATEMARLMSTDLTTFAPTVTDTASYHPTGNLLVALPEIDDQGCLRSLNVVSHTHRGVIEARGNLLTPVLQIGDRAPKLELAGGRENAWIPQGFADTVDGHVQVRFIPSLGQRYGNDAGFCAQLTYRNTTNSPQNVRLGWQGQWEEVAIRQLDRKSTRLNSSHVAISYAVFCVKKHNDLVIRLPTGTTCSLRLYF